MQNITLYRLYKQGHLRARDLLVKQNVGLVYEVSHRRFKAFRPSASFDLDDLHMAGFTGLIEAVDKWDPERGAFSTCAFYYIYMRMIRAIKEEQSLVRVPEHQFDRLKIYFKVMNDLHKVEPDDQVRQEMDLSELEFKHFLSAAKFITGQAYTHDIAKAVHLDDDDDLDIHHILQAFNKLTIQDRKLISHRFDLNWVDNPAPYVESLSYNQHKYKLSQAMTRLREQLKATY